MLFCCLPIHVFQVQFGIYRFYCKKKLTLRVDQHKGVSYRTARPLVRPLDSSIREHCSNVCENNIRLSDFKIISNARNEQELRIFESLFIKFKKPALNIDGSSAPLHIL